MSAGNCPGFPSGSQLLTRWQFIPEPQLCLVSCSVGLQGDLTLWCLLWQTEEVIWRWRAPSPVPGIQWSVLHTLLSAFRRVEHFFQKCFQMIETCQVAEIIMLLYICTAHCQSSLRTLSPFSLEDSAPGVSDPHPFPFLLCYTVGSIRTEGYSPLWGVFIKMITST